MAGLSIGRAPRRDPRVDRRVPEPGGAELGAHLTEPLRPRADPAVSAAGTRNAALLRRAAQLPAAELLGDLDSTPDGLLEREVDERLAQHGPNVAIREAHLNPAAHLAQLFLTPITALLLVLERAIYGIPFGSDAYSYLVWARDAVQHGTTHHSSFDYTVPKPLELGVAALGQVLGAPLAVYGWFTVVGQLGAIAAVAGLAYHLAGRRAAIMGGLLCSVEMTLTRFPRSCRSATRLRKSPSPEKMTM